MTIAMLVLLATCLNIANLLLARSSARQRELSVRFAVGATRMRVVRQLLTECALLTSVGTLFALLSASWGSKLLLRLVSRADDNYSFDLSMSASVVAFAAAAAFATVLVFGLAPALISVRASVNTSLKNSVRGFLGGPSRMQSMRWMLSLQTALSLALIAGASLFIGTLQNLLSVDPGVNSQGVLIANATFKASDLALDRKHAREEEVVKALQALPGVTSVAAALRTPISNYGWNNVFEPEGYKPQSRMDTLVWLNRVTPGYLHTVGTTLRKGRDFSAADSPHAQKVVIIDELSAQRFFPHDNPLGKMIGMTLHPESKKELYQVIGVVKPSKYSRLNEPARLTAFIATNQDSETSESTNFVLRSSLPLDKLIPSVRKTILTIQSETTIDFRNLRTQIDDSLLQPRALALLASIFGALGLLLAAIGLYGVTAYGVSQRRNEIGIRIALGAQRGSVIRLALRDVAVVLALGIALGLIASTGLGRLVQSLLFGLHPGDPRYFGAATLLLVFAAGGAAYFPAKKAATLNPIEALRDE